MRCPRCNNEDLHYFDKQAGRYYCRKCIIFGRVFTDEVLRYPRIVHFESHVNYQLQFVLTNKQQMVSDQLVEKYLNGVDANVVAICGAGKTEILYEVIKQALNRKESVLILIPRKALVIELAERLNKAFNVEVSVFYGGHQENPQSPFIVATIHQAYRLAKRDLVIVDEVDAFPLYNNDLLKSMVNNVRGKCLIEMSATATYNDQSIALNRRYHQHNHPIPAVYIGPLFMQIIYMFYFIKKFKGKPVLLFVPTFELLEWFKYLELFHISICIVSSKHTAINEVLDKLRNHEIDVVVTTIVLERGITIDDVQVIVLACSHYVYKTETLIQIAGRVGRNYKHPDGKVIFLSNRYSKNIKNCINYLKKMNDA